MTTHHDHTPGETGYEKSDVAVGRVALITGAAVVFTVAVIVVLFQFFWVEKEEQFQTAVYAPVSVTLRELRAREEAELSSYALLDDSLGVYRIPIDRAMQLMVDEAYAHRATRGGEPK